MSTKHHGTHAFTGAVDLSAATLTLPTAVAAALWTVSVTAAAESGNKRVLTVQAKDFHGTNLAAAKALVFKPVTSVDASYAVSDEGAGTGLTTSGDKVSTITTNASGVAEIGITDTAAETIAIAFETPKGPVVASLTFA